MNKKKKDKVKRQWIKRIKNKFYDTGTSNKSFLQVAKDLKMGENLANQVFKRPDFPSVNIGKTKTVMKLAYYIWKMKHREESEDKDNE